MVFQLVQLAVDETGLVIARKETQPLFQLREDAMVLAEFDAARTSDEYGYDAESGLLVGARRRAASPICRRACS